MLLATHPVVVALSGLIRPLFAIALLPEYREKSGGCSWIRIISDPLCIDVLYPIRSGLLPFRGGGVPLRVVTQGGWGRRE